MISSISVDGIFFFFFKVKFKPGLDSYMLFFTCWVSSTEFFSLINKSWS